MYRQLGVLVYSLKGLEYRKLDKWISADMGRDYGTQISQNTEEKSLRRASFLVYTFLSYQIFVKRTEYIVIWYRVDN